MNSLSHKQLLLARRFARQTEAALTTTHTHDLLEYRILDVINAQLQTATSVAKGQ